MAHGARHLALGSAAQKGPHPGQGGCQGVRGRTGSRVPMLASTESRHAGSAYTYGGWAPEH
eukprot:5211973-Prymnesium_polylepis.1